MEIEPQCLTGFMTPSTWKQWWDSLATRTRRSFRGATRFCPVSYSPVRRRGAGEAPTKSAARASEVCRIHTYLPTFVPQHAALRVPHWTKYIRRLRSRHAQKISPPPGFDETYTHKVVNFHRPAKRPAGREVRRLS